MDTVRKDPEMIWTEGGSAQDLVIPDKATGTCVKTSWTYQIRPAMK